jgi:hypothetical protein
VGLMESRFSPFGDTVSVAAIPAWFVPNVP